MKKIINNADEFVSESIEGLVLSYPKTYKYSNATNKVLTRANKASNKVGLVSGGGSGHLPLFTGYIGEGLLDSCAVGNVFASPSVDDISSAIKEANLGKGVLCIYGNYGGDVMNFDMASEMLEMEDIKVESIVVADDVASASKEEKEKRRGVTGMLYVFKIAGAMAETGADFDEVKRIAVKTNQNIRTMGIALTPTILPQVGKPTFEIGNDEMEIGMGIHGEPGIRRGKLKSADEITQELSDKILDDINPIDSHEFKSYHELIQFVDDRPGHDKRYAIDCSKIKRDLNWFPNEDFDSGMYKTVKWYLDKYKEGNQI